MAEYSEKIQSFIDRISNSTNRSIQANCNLVFRYLEDHVDPKNKKIKRLEKDRDNVWQDWPGQGHWEIPADSEEAKSLAYDLYSTIAEHGFDVAMDLYEDDADAAIESLNTDFLDYFQDVILEVLESESNAMPAKDQNQNTDKTKVFVVHGRNMKIRDSMFDFLRAIKLHPLEWSELTSATGKVAPFIGEVLQKAFSEAQAVLVLLTPEDEVKLKQEFVQADDPDYETTATVQARPNVLFEGGMAMGSHPDRTIFVQFGKIRPFSDILGRHMLKMDNSAEKRIELAGKLETAGCFVNKRGTDWLRVGNFEVR